MVAAFLSFSVRLLLKEEIVSSAPELSATASKCCDKLRPGLFTKPVFRNQNIIMTRRCQPFVGKQYAFSTQGLMEFQEEKL